MNIDIFSTQILLELIDHFFFFYSNLKDNSKRFKAKRYHLPKEIIDNVIINWKGVYNQSIDLDTNQYEKIRKLITRQGEDYTTGSLLDCDYIKNHYGLNYYSCWFK